MSFIDSLIEAIIKPSGTAEMKTTDLPAAVSISTACEPKAILKQDG